MSDKTSIRFYLILMILSLPFLVTGLAWKYNNPGGSSFAYWFHIGDAFSFNSLPQYQLP